MYIADTHCDTLTCMTREGLQAYYRIRDKTAQDPAPHVNAQAVQQGGLALQVMAIFISPNGGDPAQQYQNQLHTYRAWLASECQQGDPQVVQVQPDTLQHIWAAGQLGTLLSIEGGECLQDDPQAVQRVCDDGVRDIGLCWNGANGLASGINGDGGLTDIGRQVISEMERLGMWVDVSHLNERSFWDVVQAATRPVMASHSNCYQLREFPRNLTDDQIRVLIDQKGYMGINLLPYFLKTPLPGVPEAQHDVTCRDVLRHMDHVLALGGQDILGFGADLDGVGTLPHGFHGAESYPMIVQAMREAGYDQALIEKICWRNFVRYWTDISSTYER